MEWLDKLATELTEKLKQKTKGLDGPVEETLTDHRQDDTDWASELGFGSLWIQVDGPAHLPFDEKAGNWDPLATEHVRPHAFTLWGHPEPAADTNPSRGWEKNGWVSLSEISTVEFRGGKALADGEYVRDYSEDLHPWLPLAETISKGVWENGGKLVRRDVLVLKRVATKLQYGGSDGIVRPFFERVLAFHDPSRLCCVLARSHALTFAGTMEDEEIADEDLLKDSVIQAAILKDMRSWGFEPYKDSGFHIRPLGDGVGPA